MELFITFLSTTSLNLCYKNVILPSLKKGFLRTNSRIKQKSPKLFFFLKNCVFKKKTPPLKGHHPLR